MNDRRELDSGRFANQASDTPLNEVRAELAELKREIAILTKPPAPPALVAVKDVAKALAILYAREVHRQIDDVAHVGAEQWMLGDAVDLRQRREGHDDERRRPTHAPAHRQIAWQPSGVKRL